MAESDATNRKPVVPPDLRLQFLKDEYLCLQKAVEDLDGRTLIIKGWSVTFSLAAMGGAFYYHAAGALILGSITSFIFWTMEGFWKTFQDTYYDRLNEIESFFAGNNDSVIPFQIGVAWRKRWRQGGHTRRVLRTMHIMFSWPHVALPHAAITLGGMVLYALVMSGRLRL